MGVWFEGDLDCVCPSYLDPTEFGCSCLGDEHYFASSKDISKIKKRIQKYKFLLKSYEINADDLNMDNVICLGVEEIQCRLHLKFGNSVKVSRYMFSYCFGCELLRCIQKHGKCEFYIPGY